jgi:hypothetical protein
MSDTMSDAAMTNDRVIRLMAVDLALSTTRLMRQGGGDAHRLLRVGLVQRVGDALQLGGHARVPKRRK